MNDVMNDFWADIEDEILMCLRGNPGMSPSEVGRRLAISEGSAVSLLTMLAKRGKVRICLVGLPPDGDTSGPENVSKAA